MQGAGSLTVRVVMRLERAPLFTASSSSHSTSHPSTAPCAACGTTRRVNRCSVARAGHRQATRWRPSWSACARERLASSCFAASARSAQPRRMPDRLARTTWHASRGRVLCFTSAPRPHARRRAPTRLISVASFVTSRVEPRRLSGDDDE